ncbi:MAG TPA: prepilin-type N-terminal cleavage/methylation domain-containing protein [Fimbriimonadaceae bacterium]|nr:prepilin-type N-terminal cleavage/methylation domain-containing protein [Fimbriimonadaceae bacterium]
MKKAFTLIELLVVIAIIAILAAILFPVFAQAKVAAKKAAGLSAVKQIGTATHIYLSDYDDVLPPYRHGSSSGPVINPFYLKLQAAGDPRAATLASQGATTIRAIFFNQMLEPYHKSDELFKNSQNPEAWVGFQDKGTWDMNFHSYGGQNSYAANNYLLKSNQGAPTSAIDQVSNTLLFVDATYYNALPAQPNGGTTLCHLNGITLRTNNDEFYWKHLGNNKLDFNNKGNPDPNNTANTSVLKNIENRYSGVLNVVMADSSAKSHNAKKIVTDLVAKGAESMWNPGKTNCQ